MLIPKKDRDAVYRYVYDEGVLVAKKDFNAPRHPNLSMPNLHVLKCMQSLESKGYVKSQFSWQYFYYILTDAGMSFLNQYFKLPPTVLPKTFKKAKEPSPSQSSGRTFGGNRESGPRADRDGGRRDEYRRAPGEGKESGPSGTYAPRFGSVGRGRPLAERS